MARIPTGSIFRPTYKHKGVKKQSATWWLKYYRPGNPKPIRESARTEDQNEAIQALRQKMASVAFLGDATPERVTVNQLFDLMVTEWKQSGHRSTGDLLSKLEVHLRPAFGTMKAAALTSQHIRRFISSKQPNYANASINRFLAVLRRAMHIGTEQSPPLVIRVPHFPTLEEAEPRQGILGHEQYQELRRYLPDYGRIAFVIGYHTGARRGEILSIRLREHVDLEKLRILRPGSATKSKKPRYLPIYGDMEAEIRAALATNKDYLIERDGLPVASFPKSWATARTMAGVPEQLFHDLRRTALTNMIEAGFTEKEAMEVSGHKTRDVFDRYCIVSSRRLREKAEKLAQSLAAKGKVGKVPGKDLSCEVSKETVN